MWRLLIDSWHGFVPAPWLQVTLAITAAVCGAIVGAERERKEKPAGLRTLVLVSLGSAVFTMVSYAFTTPSGMGGRGVKSQDSIMRKADQRIRVGFVLRCLVSMG